MQQTGFIKVFRSITNKGWYKDSECVALWLHLLLKANHKEAEFMLGYSIIKLLPGQLVTGRKALSYETGISESKIERILKLFEIEQQIEQQTNSRNRIITILSWDAYQKSEQQMDSPRTASEQPVDTNNKNNNNKNDNNVRNKGEKFKIKEIVFPFDSENFMQAWNLWKQYKKEQFRFTYQSIGEQAALKDLAKLANGDETKAVELIHHAISKSWKGIYPKTEDKKNGHTKKERPIYTAALEVLYNASGNKPE
jgi:hypothetical protein